MKKRFLSLVLTVLIVWNVAIPIFSFGNEENQEQIIKNNTLVNNSLLTDVNDKEEQEDEENYTEEYKEWLKLPEEEKEKYAVIPRKYKVPFSVLYEDEDNLKTSFSNNLRRNLVAKASQEEQLPERFDLRDKIEIPVRNQGNYGLCWDFASIKCLETYLALNGYGDFDFSELHLDYLESNKYGVGRIEHDGGDFETFIDYLSVMKDYGPVLENEFPYNSIYSEDDYERLLSFTPKAYVNDIIEFPSINKNNNEYSSEEIKEIRKEIKEHIIKNGSLYCCICSSETETDGKQTQDITMKYYKGKCVLNYQGNHMSNHAVNIIGWDDNFDKENFPEECKPQENGAYIAINSWGEQFGENGVFYISYEDKWVESDLSGITNASTKKQDTITEISLSDVNLYNALKEEFASKNFNYDDNTLSIFATKLEFKSIDSLNLENKNINNLDGIENFPNLFVINASNNNITSIEIFRKLKVSKVNLENNRITDVSPLENCNQINISGNPIESGLDNLTNVSKLTINNCDLNNIQKEQIINLPKLKELFLQNDNIKDVSFLEQVNIETLDLSGNKELYNLNKLTNVENLVLENCNFDDSIVDSLKQLENLRDLDLARNNITNAEIFSNFNTLYSIDLSYTNIKDVESLKKFELLKLNGNKNLTNLDKLNNTWYLELNDCGLSNFSFVSNLYKLNELYLRKNDLTTIPNFLNTSLDYLDLGENKIEDISEIKNCINTDICQVYLGDNLIRNIPENLDNRRAINFQNNYISKIPEQSNNMYYNQKIIEKLDIEVNKNNRVVLPQIFTQELKYYYRYEIETKNCSIDTKNGELIIIPSELGEEEARVTLKNAKSKRAKSKRAVFNSIDGTSFIVNYNAKESVNKVSLELGNSKYKEAYLVGEKFDNSNLEVRYILENGISQLVTNYEMENWQNLQENQNSIKIKYDGKELEVPITVFENNNYDITFSKEIYSDICELLSNDILYADIDGRNVRCIIKKEAIDNLTQLNLNNSKTKQNYTGLSELFNLKELELIDNALVYEDKFFEEIGKLEKLEKLNLYNCTFNGNKEPNKEFIQDIIDLPKLQLIDFGETTINIFLSEKKYYLPKYLTENDIDNIQVKCRYAYGYGEGYEEPDPLFEEEPQRILEYTSEELPIYVDNNNNLYIMLDTDIGENKLYTSRKANINIDTNKIKGNINVDYIWSNETDKPTVTITGQPLDKTVNVTDSNTVTYTFSWNEKVYGFSKDSITVENGQKGEFIEITPNKVYTLVVTNNVAENEEVIQKITVNENVCEDIASNGNEKAEKEITINRKKTDQPDSILKNSSKYSIKGTKIEGIRPSTTISDFINNFNEIYEVKIIKNGNEVTEGLIGTGMEILVKENNQEKANLVAIVTGDLTGNGKMGIGDLTKLSRYAVGLDDSLTGPYLEASDLVKDGKYGRIGDITKMSRILAGLDDF